MGNWLFRLLEQSMDRFQELRVFVAVAETGGFAKAAGVLGSSPPAVSRTIAALEDRLGARLFNRTTRTVHLTETGQLFLRDAQTVLSVLTQAEEAVRGETQQPSGSLSITASVAFGRTVLQPIVAEFLETYPRVDVTLLLLDRIVDLVDEGIDVAVRIASLPDSTLILNQVGTVNRMLVASPDYLAKYGKPLNPSDLASHTVISHTTLAPNRELSFASGGKRARIKIKPRLELNDALTGIDLARRGLGISVALSYMVADAIASGQLIRVLPAYEQPAVPVQLVHAQRRYMSPKVRAFIDFSAPRLRAALST